MLKNTHINIEATKKVATLLGDLNDVVVYVGGAIVSYYIDDSAAEDVRPTKDIDIMLEIASLGELEALRLQLVDRGFSQEANDPVRCRFHHEDILLDVMATKEIDWAPGDIWFEKGISKKVAMKVDDIQISILPIEFYLASKLSAFIDRSGSDPRTSKDLEDIVYLFNHTSAIDEQVINGNKEAFEFIHKNALDILESEKIKEAMLAHLDYENQQSRFDGIISKLETIAKVV